MAKSVAPMSWSCSQLLKPQSHRTYDQVMTYLRRGKYWNRGQVVERTYDWSHRSWRRRSSAVESRTLDRESPGSNPLHMMAPLMALRCGDNKTTSL